MNPRPDSEVLFIGGRSGVGKTSAALGLHALLTERNIAHAVIEGDYLDLAHPAPWQEPGPWPEGLAARNLSALWGNYRQIGHRRLIYTNTVSVCETVELSAAMGDAPRVRAVLLRASDDCADSRLRGRESGSALQDHVVRSARMAADLDRRSPAWVKRIDTDARPASEVAGEILAFTGWAAPAPD